MHLADLIKPERVWCNATATSKKKVLERLSELLVTGVSELSSSEVFESLVARERLGSTGLGKGVAIPHGRVKVGGQTLLAFIRLEQGIDYDAPDGMPVDLLCALVVPPESTDEHLQILASLSEMFSDERLREQLHKAADAHELYERLLEWATAKRHSE